jgi:hypothetical protein
LIVLSGSKRVVFKHRERMTRVYECHPLSVPDKSLLLEIYDPQLLIKAYTHMRSETQGSIRDARQGRY